MMQSGVRGKLDFAVGLRTQLMAKVPTNGDHNRLLQSFDRIYLEVWSLIPVGAGLGVGDEDCSNDQQRRKCDQQFNDVPKQPEIAPDLSLVCVLHFYWHSK